MTLLVDLKHINKAENKDYSSIEKSLLNAVFDIDLEKVKRIMSQSNLILNFHNFEPIALIYKKEKVFDIADLKYKAALMKNPLNKEEENLLIYIQKQRIPLA